MVGLATKLGLTPNVALTGVAAGAAAMATTDATMAALNVSNPHSWTASQWASDALPHLAYGLVTAAVVKSVNRG